MYEMILDVYLRKTFMKLLRLLTAGVTGLSAGIGGGAGCEVEGFLLNLESNGSDFLLAILLSSIFSLTAIPESRDAS
jgi:hypothetical protein